MVLVGMMMAMTMAVMTVVTRPTSTTATQVYQARCPGLVS